MDLKKRILLKEIKNHRQPLKLHEKIKIWGFGIHDLKNRLENRVTYYDVIKPS